MENTLVISLKLGLLVFSVILIGIVVSWTLKHLGFYKRDWIMAAISSVVLFIFGMAIFIVLGISKNSFVALRENVIFIGKILLGFIILCFLLVLLRNFIRKRKILFISPNLNSLSEKEKVAVEKYLGNLRKTRFRIHFHVIGVLPKGQSCLDTFSHLTELISNADEIHIWRVDKYIDEIAFILGVYFHYRNLFWSKNVVIANNGSFLLEGKNIIDKVLSELEWSGC